MAITSKQINKVADDLAAAGTSPTMALIREKIGGSYSTISPVLKTWKEEHKMHVAQTEQAPQEAIEAGKAAAVTIWAAAMQTAAGRIDDAQKLAAEKVSEAEAERDETLAEIDRLEALVVRLESELADASGLATQAQHDYAETKAALAAATATADERGKRIEDQARELTEIRHLIADTLEAAQKRVGK